MARVLIRELGPERSAMAIDRVRAMVAGGGSPSRRMEERPLAPRLLAPAARSGGIPTQYLSDLLAA